MDAMVIRKDARSMLTHDSRETAQNILEILKNLLEAVLKRVQGSALAAGGILFFARPSG